MEGHIEEIKKAVHEVLDDIGICDRLSSLDNAIRGDGSSGGIVSRIEQLERAMKSAVEQREWLTRVVVGGVIVSLISIGVAAIAATSRSVTVQQTPVLREAAPAPAPAR